VTFALCGPPRSTGPSEPAAGPSEQEPHAALRDASCRGDRLQRGDCVPRALSRTAVLGPLSAGRRPGREAPGAAVGRRSVPAGTLSS